MTTADHLAEVWLEQCRKYSDNESIIRNLWLELSGYYQAEGRHYHNLNHIRFLIDELRTCKDNIRNWDAIIFAAFYHDVIYNTGRGDNEQQSAALAAKRLEMLCVDRSISVLCADHILATASHNASENEDRNIFIDADLSILGASWDQYLDYSRKIRQEYIQVLDALYKPGRRGVLLKFLNRNRIFSNRYFFEKYERQAKENISQELQLLT